MLCPLPPSLGGTNSVPQTPQLNFRKRFIYVRLTKISLFTSLLSSIILASKRAFWCVLYVTLHQCHQHSWYNNRYMLFLKKLLTLMTHEVCMKCFRKQYEHRHKQHRQYGNALVAHWWRITTQHLRNMKESFTKTKQNKSKMVIYASTQWVTSALKQWGQGGSTLVDSLRISFVNLNKRHLESITSISLSSRTLHFSANPIGLMLLLRKGKVLLQSMTMSVGNWILDVANASFDPPVTIGNHPNQSVLLTTWNNWGRQPYIRPDPPMRTFLLQVLQNI